VNGVPAGEQRIDRYGWQEIAFDFVAGQADSTLECVLGVNRTWRPADTGGTDTRRLGVRVHRIWQR